MTILELRLALGPLASGKTDAELRRTLAELKAIAELAVIQSTRDRIAGQRPQA